MPHPVLRSAAAREPLLPRAPSREPPPPGARRPSSGLAAVAPEPSRRNGTGVPTTVMVAAAMSSELDIVQFSAPMYFVEEEEVYLEVDVMRLGQMRGTCSVKWHTEDSTGVAGQRYAAGTGQLVFEDGQDTKSIRIEILADPRWETTQEFKINLCSPIDCELGQYLHHCRVKVIDSDVFPSSRYKTHISMGPEGIERIPVMGLSFDVFALMFRSPSIGRRTLWMIALNQLENLYVLFQLYINIYMVDVLFNLDPESESKLFLPSRRQTALLIGAMYILPMFVLHLVDFRQVRLDVGGMCREFVMTNLFRKYLNFSEKTRDMVSAATMQVAILQDSSEVVEGYMSVIELIKSILKLAILTFFILKENSNALVPAILMPTAMALFVVVRTRKLIEACEVVALRTAKVVEAVQEAVNKYTVIAEYMQRPAVCHLFNQATSSLTEAGVAAEEVTVNNHYFPKWLGPTFIGCYIAFYAGTVLDGASLGPFLATIRVFKELSEEFLEMYMQLMTIASAAGPLRKLTWLFNLPTDAPIWKRINRQRREKTKSARQSILAGTSENKDADKVFFRSDLIKIECVDLAFGFKDSNPVLRNVNISVDQGKLVAIVGDHGTGKKTFLRILGHFLFPTSGFVFIPTYLRIVHVSQEPVMLDLSVWKNLTFGAPHESEKRVIEVLKALEMDRTLELLQAELKSEPGLVKMKTTQLKVEASSGENDDDSGEIDLEGDAADEGEVNDESEKWQKTLNYVEIAKIHLARALVVNPEVLVLQKPLLHYGDKVGEKIAKILKSNVTNRGVCMPQENASRRRPRTCFYSPSTDAEAKGADLIWQVSEDLTVHESSRDGFTNASIGT